MRNAAACPTPARRLLLLCALLVISHCATLTAGLHFYLDAGKRRCFSDSASPNTKVLIEYTVSTGAGIMPVDLTVSLAEGNKHLLSKDNVEHGKVAFVVPFPDGDLASEHVHHAEAHHRHHDHHQQHHHAHAHGDHEQNEQKHARHGQRRLLSVDDHKHDPDHEHFHDTHDNEHDHHHGIEHPNDHHLYDEEMDDLDDMDWDDYDGVHDEDMERELDASFKDHQKRFPGGNRPFSQAAGPPQHVLDEATEEEEVFSVRKFELCVSNAAERNREEAKRRRVRLVIRKGDTALDYTRLAKTHHMSHLETSLKKISNELMQLMAELDHTQHMEHILYKLNEGTNRQIVILGIVSLVVMASVAAYQATYTKQYFKRKKIV